MDDAFHTLATRHAFPVETAGEPGATAMQMAAMLGTDGIYALVAEQDGVVVGSAFQDERGTIVGIGPVSVGPAAQGGVGRALMEALMRRCEERAVAGVRLVQTAYNYRSLSLYAKLGFVVREPLSVFQGTTSPKGQVTGDVRAATVDDIERCDDICRSVHGHNRDGELRSWVTVGMARVVERGGRITGYATGCGYLFHAVGITDEDVIALLANADMIVGLGFLVPSRNPRLMTWCLDSGLRLVQQSTLMSIGLYNEPQGSWLPSIGY
jgi:hypothetical protein